MNKSIVFLVGSLVMLLPFVPNTNIFSNANGFEGYGYETDRYMRYAEDIQISASLSTSSSCIVPPEGMIAWWPGDGNTNDIQGISSGSIDGEVLFTPGKVDDAFTFNGNGKVTTPLNSIPGGTGSVTFDFWIKIPTAPTSVQDVVGIDGVLQFIAFSDGDLAAVVTVNTSDGPLGLSLVDPFPADNEFHHVAVVYDSSIGIGLLYLDGIEVEDSFPVDPGTELVSSGQGGLTIGDISDANLPFVGSIDEIEVYNLALTQNQVQSIYNAGNAGKCKLSPPEMVDEIIEIVESFDLPTGTENSLISNLPIAAQLLNDANPNNDNAACGILNSFLQKVSQQLENNKITEEQSIILSDKANVIITELGC